MQIRKQRAGHKLAGNRISRLLALALFAASAGPTVAADLPPLSGSIGVWGDYNKDGLMDVLLAGAIQGVASIPDGRFTRIYRNTGEGTFEALATPLPQLDNAAAAWGDCDTDGDLDLLVAGFADGTNGPVALTEIYRNDGSNQFTALNAGLQGRGQGSVAWLDYDNDGDADIFVTGLNTGTTNWATQLYRNNGNNTFTLQSANLPGLTNGVGHWGDYDNDGDADLLLVGPDATYLFRNDGEGVFANSSPSIPSQHRVISPWGDFDGDGDLDFMTSLATTPSVFGPDYHPSITHNLGGGVLNSYPDFSLDMWLNSANWGDIDNSGRAGVVVSGWIPLVPGGGVWGSATKVYIYLGSGWQEVFTLGGWDNRSETWVDFDGDGDLDIFTTSAGLTTFWTNNLALHRDFPQPPLNPTNTFTALDAVTLSWQSPSNTPTTGRGLTYNVRVGGTSGGVDVVSPLADPATGRRLVHAVGNAGTAHLFKLNSLPPGDYFWSVQSISQSYTGSPFTTEGVFTVTGSPPIVVTQPTNLTVFAGSNGVFAVSVVGTKPLAYQWRKGGIPLADGADLFGGAAATLTISNAQPAHAGAYDVVITNAYGATTSLVATLEIDAVPRIITQPANQYVLLTRNATFSVAAAGAVPLSFQWQLNGTPLSDDARFSGAATPMLNIQNVHSNDVGGYSVIVSNAWGSITSSVATLNLAFARYVNVNNPSPAAPYLTWVTAATVIQDAINVAGIGDEILVTNGVYQSGSVSTGQPNYARHRIALNKALTVLSVNGPAFTTIVGMAFPNPSSGIRCAYLTNGSTLAGFTLTGGETDLGDISGLNQRGAGVLCQSVNCVVSNCVISGNVAGRYGGGAYSGTLINCVLVNNTVRDIQGARLGDGGGAYGSNLRDCIVANNSARYSGGGVHSGTATNCLIRGNSAVWGGGAASTLVNCTIVGNTSVDDGGLGGAGGGGTAGGTAVNSIVMFNNGGYGAPNYWRGEFSYCCASPQPGGVGNISFDPLFVDRTNGNYRLQAGSPCINVGTNAPGLSVDLDGLPRVVDGVVDMGAFESQQLPWAVSGPMSQSVLLNSNALFTVSTVGALPFAYQWQKDGVNLSDDGRISGVSTPALTISNLVTQDAGGYRVIVTNPFGMATSSVANLTVLLPPSVVVPPTNQSVGIGATASFSVLVAGSPPLAYLWRKDGTNLANGGTISGADTALLQIANAGTNDAGSYDVAVTSPYGATTSAPALLSLLPLAINTQPASRTVPAGTNATFTVGASGLGTISYQWRFNQADLPGKTNASVTLTNVQSANAGDYDVVVTNVYSALTSSVATLTVLPVAPTITTQAVSRVASVGQTVSLVVAAKGTEPMICQWQFNRTDLANANGFTLTLANVNASFAGTYRAAVSNSAGFAFSTNVTLVVSPVVVWPTNNQQVSGNLTIPASVTNVIAIAAGKVTDYGRPCFALRADGELVKWGGFGSVPASTTNVVAISAGGLGSRGENNLALIGDGTVVHWNLAKQVVPAAITNGGLAAVAAGATHQLVLRGDGTVFAWGGGGPLQTNVPPSATNVVAIAAGNDTSLALRADGTVVVWGPKASSQAAAFSNVLNVAAVSAGGNQALGLRTDGSAFGHAVTNSEPQVLFYGPPPPNATNLTAVAAGLNHSLVLRADGTVMAWGSTNFGNTLPPPFPSNVVAIAAGTSHSLALLRDPFAPPIPPRIARPPLSRSVFAGQRAVFNALAVGGLPLSSQWLRNGAPLAGQTNQWLAFSTVQLSDAGNYQLVVTNESGSVTSAVLSVTVIIPPPVLQSLQVVPSGFSFSFQSVNGVLYVSEYRDTLSPGAWIELERRTGSGGLETISDATAQRARRFYRVRVE